MQPEAVLAEDMTDISLSMASLAEAADLVSYVPLLEY